MVIDQIPQRPSVHVPKILAFVLPQFHAIPENDAWWGKGFTEWTNVRKAKPLFPGHRQPRLPKDGRYYNLLDPATLDWQAELARSHGIHGFCYYHYWFAGRQLLEKPVELLLQRGKPDIPFCLAWANEPWTRAWDGGDREVLMPQNYGGPADWKMHFDYLLRVFSDSRYIRVNGAPMMLIYRSASIPELGPMCELWRTLARQAGLPGLHLVCMRTSFPVDPRVGVFDAYAEFEPMYTMVQPRTSWWRRHERRYRRWYKLTRFLWPRPLGPKNSYDYQCLWRAIAERKLPRFTYPGGFADWDNTPRRGLKRGMLMRNFSQSAFAAGIRTQVRKASEAGAEFLFFNAWNEWAEGTYLEPDEAQGLFFLETIRDALAELQRSPNPSATEDRALAANITHPQAAMLRR